LVYVVSERRGALAFASERGVNISQERRSSEMAAAVKWRFIFAFVDEFSEWGFGGESYITL